jgi:hypothetical protein
MGALTRRAIEAMEPGLVLLVDSLPGKGTEEAILAIKQVEIREALQLNCQVVHKHCMIYGVNMRRGLVGEKLQGYSQHKSEEESSTSTPDGK